MDTHGYRVDGRGDITHWPGPQGEPEQVDPDTWGWLKRHGATDGTIHTGSAGLKVGVTSLTVAHRIGQLQCGNPRKIHPVAEVRNVPPELEVTIHEALTEQKMWMSGEWFQFEKALNYASDRGGLEGWLGSYLQEWGGSVFVYDAFKE